MKNVETGEGTFSSAVGTFVGSFIDANVLCYKQWLLRFKTFMPPPHYVTSNSVECLDDKRKRGSSLLS